VRVEPILVDSHDSQRSVYKNFVATHDYISPIAMKTQIGADSN